jgi:GTP-binding protein
MYGVPFLVFWAELIMFLDCLTLHLEAGHGGAGVVSFRHEKSAEYGGPDGGDGGRGGSISLRANRSLNTLNPFRNQRNFCAGRGASGEGGIRHGGDGASLILDVPLGTIVKDTASGVLLAELLESGQIVCLAKGGIGGQGNHHYKTSTNRTPRRAQPGLDGEILDVELELKLIADVGLLGFPNAGKSTLVSRISAARPKIANYPFTTLEPQLGVVTVDELDSFVIADIPGLIEGAATGTGLGIQFLRHVERTRMLLHLVDLADPLVEPEEAVKVIESELKSFSPALLAKPCWLVGTKIDAMQDESRQIRFENLCHSRNQEPIFISGVTGYGIRPLVFMVSKELAKIRHD